MQIYLKISNSFQQKKDLWKNGVRKKCLPLFLYYGNFYHGITNQNMASDQTGIVE